ncbi:MAG TPA: hypothetical protein VLM18_12185 [Croceibacterium sp.]|nr:hypothetical protein [Croceibacterium sp.]
MEAALSRLAMVLQGLDPDDADVLSAFGKANRRLSERMRAVRAAGELYFMRCPNQDVEGRLADMMEKIDELAIKRHRVAHGHIAMATPDIDSAQLASDLAKGPVAEFEVPLQYRWGPPYYSMHTLKLHPLGVRSETIDHWREEFWAQCRVVIEFTAALA